MAVVFTLIGDLVRSRRAASRSDVHLALTRALEATAGAVPPVDRLEVTVGDEFQGVFADFGSAAHAALLVRLHLAGTVDARCGLGAGEREVFEPHRTPMLQDGPAWWSARAAVDVLGASSHRLRRTWFDGTHADGEGPSEPLANAYLTTRDALVDRLNPHSRRMLLLSLQGHSQREIAELLAISQSAVSQAFAKGVGAVRDAATMMITPRPEGP